MTRLSVNINKIATLRNARGGNNPSVLQAAVDLESFGAQGITVHPRPDERHIRYSDVYDVKKIVKTEFNIEGYPNEKFIELVLAAKPDQVTFVPDSPDVLTSNAGWKIKENQDLLNDIIGKMKDAGIRTSLFIDPDLQQIEALSLVNPDRIELYTEGYASEYLKDRDAAIQPYVDAAKLAHDMGYGINAGHDLDLNNLKFFHQNIAHLAEVSIGHALICDALYLGLENAVQLYLRELK